MSINYYNPFVFIEDCFERKRNRRAQSVSTKKVQLIYHCTDENTEGIKLNLIVGVQNKNVLLSQILNK